MLKVLELFCERGSNSNGQLGLGVLSEQSILPVAVNLASNNIKFITGGGNHSFICDTENSIYSCGKNDRGQLADSLTDATFPEFRIVTSCHFPRTVSKIACGWDFTLCLLDIGEVHVWGSNSFGQLGLPLNKVKSVSSPQKVDGGYFCVDIACGLRHSCLVTDRGSVLCAGSNTKGQLAVSCEKGHSKIDKFTEVPGVQDIRKVACGEHFCLALDKKDGICVWGDNKFGQLGEDPKKLKLSRQPKTVPLPPGFDQPIKQIYCGWTHCSLLTERGIVLSWGRSDYGQLGERRERSWEPKVLACDFKFNDLAVGSEHTVGLTITGLVLCWGWNEHSNCGNGEIENDTVMDDYIDLSLVNDYEVKIDENHCSQEISRLSSDASYEEFFSRCLLRNEPCIIENIAERWPCVEKWVTSCGDPNIEGLAKDYGASMVNVAQCSEKIYNVQKKVTMTLEEYCCYWENRDNTDSPILYLKDWHFTKEYPNDDAYRVPKYFASDWLNEYYNRHLELDDDYRFVYIGPKGSWTPLHADVFTSYSWSVNVIGRKKWILMRPGVEERFRDNLGNLEYGRDFNPSSEPGLVFHIEQGPRDAIFVPSGWHHQVWNLEDTISINHNWINGCNILSMWSSMRKCLQEVKKEIEDCRDMENWEEHCQLMLKALYGFNYEDFYGFLVDVINSRIAALRSNAPLKVYGSWQFRQNHLIFDIKQALNVLLLFPVDSDVQKLEKSKTAKSFDSNFCTLTLKFLDELKTKL